MGSDSQSDSGNTDAPLADAQARLPPGRHGLPREVVLRNQHERLIAGAVKAVEERGSGVRVTDIVRNAQVSRKTFYEHFSNKKKCLDAAGVRIVDKRVQQAPPPSASDQAPSVRRPKAQQEVIAHYQRERIVESTTKVVEKRGFAGVRVTDIVRNAQVSRKTFYENFSGIDECIEAVFGAPLASLQDAEGKRRFGTPVKDPPPELVHGTQRERLIAAAAKAVKERGYSSATAQDIIHHAGVSSVTFYELFSDKDECFEAARGISLMPAAESPER